ncbi:MAG: hypothetical protein ABH843_06300 [Candidatus Omnitrophota bacterium]
MLIIRIAIFFIGLACLFYSSVCSFKPELGIKIFQAWCRSINWKVEPIRYDLEIRNTRSLGIFGLVLSIALLYKAFF